MDGKPRHSSRFRQPPSQPPSAMRISTEHMAEHANPATDKQPPSPPPRLPGMEGIPDAGEVAEAAVWEWGGGLLDFTIDDDAPLILPWGAPEDRRMPSPPLPPPTDPAPLPPPQQQSSAPPPAGAAGGSSHVRKRDPRLVCENYLAGRVPCSCPEMDELELELELEDEVADAVAGVRKRARVGGVSVGVARCQVPECEADISELKGYHRRHRICLRCANASSVILDGEHKRYCQQCGKFHILPDFDEGKRSCRRKLERHNKRRRRRPANDRNVVEEEKEPEGGLLPDNTCSGEPMKELSNEFASKTVNTVSNKLMDRLMLLESEDGRGSSPICSLPTFENVQSNNAVSFAASGIDQVDERTDNTKSALSSTFCDNKSVYSSVCPTGRISFKLYDWNPAEFPRRLRHQIFEWLASMPVELEGYIRPGCTILTLFIAMPQFMWGKLNEDVVLYVKALVNAPGSLFLGRTNFVIYVNSWIVQILKDGTLQMSAKMAGKAPRLHYVYPTYFEAGKPIEFVACGSDLDQPRFQFLVSFSGKYMVCDSCHAISHGKVCLFNGEQGDSKHEMFRIIITQTDSEVFGPAFIEVENESGLSNFVAVLFGNKHICSELERIEEAFCGSSATIDVMSQIAGSGVSPSLCKLLASKQIAMSEVFLDIAWLLKNPKLDKKEVAMSSAHIQRLTSLFKFSMQKGFVCVLEVILFYLVNMTDLAGLEMPVNMTSDTDLELLLNHLCNASEILNQRSLYDVRPELESRGSVHRFLMPQSCVKRGIIYTVPCKNQDVETRCRDILKEENIPPVATVVAHRKHCTPHLGARRSLGSRSYISAPNFAVFVTVGVVMCLGLCVVLLHPRKAGEFAVSIRRCLFGGPLT